MANGESETTRVAILGCGAIGGVVAVHLAKTTDVELTIVTTNAVVRDVWTSTGPTFDGKTTGIVLPSSRMLAKVSDQSGPFDFVFVAVQPTEIESVVHDVLPFLHENSKIVCLPNGLCEERIAEIVGENRVIGAVVAWGARMPEPGSYRRTSSGGFRIGKLDGKPDPALDRVAKLLASIGEVIPTTNLRGARFSKLALNCTVSTIGTIGGDTLGALLRKVRARRIALSILREAVRIADAEGIELEPVTHLDLNWFRGVSGSVRPLLEHSLLLAVGLRYRKMRSSMLAAIERGRTPAVDFLNGEVVARGKRLGIPTPVNEAAQRIVWEIARGERAAGPDALRAVLDLSETLHA